MVQSKATPKPASQSVSHAKLERRSLSSFQLQQQSTSSKGGRVPIKRRLKMERSPPNYMKPTRCSNARAEMLLAKKKSPNDSETRSFAKSTKKKNTKVVVFNKHTCSSTLKHSKFPTALDLSPGATEAEGTSVVKVCPYSYCSLNGHGRLEPLPSLKRFVSARKKLLKNQKALPDDFLVEIYTEAPKLIRGSRGDEATDVTMNFIEHVACEQRVEVDAYNELLSIEKTFFPDDVEESDDASSSEDLRRSEVSNLNSESCEPVSSSGEDTETEDVLENDIAESDGPAVHKFTVSEIIEDDVNEEADDANSSSINTSVDLEHTKARPRITRKKMIEEPKEEKEFNPRGPRFLEAEADPEAEKVDLRHRMMDGRKNSEEWMIDYALRRALMKMAPARKKKVALLVEAFETVAPVPVWEKPSRHGASGLTHARIIQACN